MSEESGALDGPVVGIDAGATRSRVLVVAAEGARPVRREGPPAAVDPRRPARSARTLVELLRRMADEGELTLPAAALCAGIAGAGRGRAQEELASEFEEAGMARRVLVHSDGAVALHDAHGQEAGLVLVAGTGSVAWGRDASGRIARAGGWGPVLGDEGSGHAIARAALRRITQSADGRKPPTPLALGILNRLALSRADELVEWVAHASRAEIAALAPCVVELADAEVAPAPEIVTDAVQELVRTVDAVRRQLAPWPQTPDVALAGGLLKPGGALRRRVSDALSARPLAVQETAVDPARGAAILALRAAGGPAPPGGVFD